MMNQKKIEKELKAIHNNIECNIKSTLTGFRRIYKNGSDADIFAELVFCILTPQMKPKHCWDAVLNLRKKDLLLKGSAERITGGLSSVRFRNKRGEYIAEARRLFMENGRIAIKSGIDAFGNPHDARKWFVKNIKGIGYKEASHFLRNIGKGSDFAILDRHILKNICLLGLIKEMPVSISEKKYIAIEEDMRLFAKEISIPLSHLDLVMWYKETGFIFK
ncbi:N-glycosylase/DNA lyase [candidate division KSB1 bacterium]